MNSGMGDMHSQFDQYLDGLMDEPQRREFQRALAERAELRRELQAQQSIDHSLKRLFPVRCKGISLNGAGRSGPPLSANAGVVGVEPSREAAVTGRVARRLPRVTPWRAVAAVLALGLLGWVGWIGYQASPLARTPLERLYAQGSYADWECKDEAEFIRTFQDKLKQGLRLVATPENVNIRGLKYAKVISIYTVVLCAQVDDRDAFVLVDHLASDKPLELRESSGLHLFRREVNTLVLYELTPWDTPTLLELLEPASVPPSQRF